MPVTLSAKIIAGLVLLAVIGSLLIFGPSYCHKLQSEAAQSRVDEAIANGQVQAARDATGITANAMTGAAAIDQQTRTNDGEIHNAQGASDPVGAGVDDAGRRALCLRSAYRNQPGCVALLQPHPAPAK